MPAITDVALCNISLLRIGDRGSIQSLNPSDGSKQADACSQLYSYVFNALARTAPWNCLRKQATLSLIAAATGTPENPTGDDYPQPPTPYLYSYALPSDCLMVRYLVPSLPAGSGSGTPQTTASIAAATTFPGVGQIYFAVAYDTDSSDNPIQVILTNQSQAQAVYTVNQSNPTIWDSLFQDAFTASLAAYLVPALSLNLPLMQINIKAAEGAIAVARRQDNNEGVTTQNRDAIWITARGSYWANSAYANNWVGLGWDSMVWPGGGS